MGSKIGSWFKGLFTKFVFTTTTEGSAAYKVAVHEAKVLEARGAVIALKAAEKVTNSALDELEKAAAEVHAGRDAIHARIEKLSETLGF
jgi:hypothetical protein